MSAHSEKLLAHFQNPKNAGVLDSPSVSVEVENPACGDLLRLAVRVEGGRIVAVRYQVRGCTASIAAGSVLTELMEGRDVTELREISRDELTGKIDAALGVLARASKHAAILCADGLAAILKKL